MAIRKMIGSLVPSGPAVLGGLARTLGRPAPLVGATPHDVVFRENKWSLLRYRPHAPGSGGADVVTHRHPILLVPSLINRHYVLDLMPGKSFAEYLARQGYDVFCIDWGTPEDEDRYLTFDDFVDRYIGRALRVTCRTAGSGKAHLLGYCLGGTMAIIHAALHEERIASLALVAAPVRFDDESLLALWTQSPTFDVDALVQATGNVPWPLMQAAFQLLRPTLNLAKAVSLLAKSPLVQERPSGDDEKRAQEARWEESLDGFFALETWGSDNVSFPGEAYLKYIRALYRDNALVRGELSISGRRVRLEDVTVPLLAVTFEHDNIVPHASASDVLTRVASARKAHVHVPGGHVGAMVSSGAARGVWPKIERFFRDTELAR
ncbi:MAG: alpha/beta fold hydrolase [Deltaproteobacteria bacterium]|jgi:polyhydroxyalkanoate synthase